MRKCGGRGRWTAVAVGVAAAILAGGCAAGGGSGAPAGTPAVASPGSTGLTGAAGPADLVIRDVRLFDGDGVRERASVVVRDGRIAGVVAPGAALPEAARVVAGGGMTLLPGLLDAHAHTFAPQMLEASLAFGVTTVLDMFTAPELVAQWRREQEAGGAVGRADLFSSGVLATAEGGHGTQYGIAIPTVDSPADAPGFVADRVAEGSDYIKIVVEDGSSYGMSLPTLDEPRVTALVEAAHAHDRLAVVHVARIDGAALAARAGADGLVHVWADATPDAELLRSMRRSGMFVIPTLTVVESTAGTAGGASLVNDARIGPLLDPAAETSLQAAFPTRPDQVASFDSAMASVTMLHGAGVPILAGSDAPNPGTTHGASVHRELELLVAAGLTPLDALRSATSVTADAFGLEDRGRIRPGARADLVLVEGDPVREITATRAIRGVWKAGVPFDRDAYAARIAAARAEREASRSAPARGAGPISDFDDGTTAAAFGQWTETTDRMMGGKSDVDVAVEPDAAGHALRVRGEVASGSAYPWSGVMFSPSASAGAAMEPVNLSGAEGIAFRARGDGGTYQVMLFHQEGGPVPATVNFTAGPEWSEQVVPWEAFGADGTGVFGFAFVKSGDPGTFEFRLDDVRLR